MYPNDEIGVTTHVVDYSSQKPNQWYHHYIALSYELATKHVCEYSLHASINFEQRGNVVSFRSYAHFPCLLVLLVWNV